MTRRIFRYLRLYRVFVETCIARETEFRANFWANVATNTAWLFFFVAFIKVIFLNTTSIADWTEAEAFTLTGTFGLVTGLFGMVIHDNLSRLPELVRLGTLDFVVTRPVNAQFFVSTRYVKLDSIGNVIGALGVILYGASTSGATFSPVNILAYLYLLGCGMACYYGVYMLVMTLAFWLVRVENLAVLCDVVFNAARYPIDIFRGIAWRVAVYVVPLAFIASFPVRALFGRLEPGWLVIGTLLAVALPAASIAFWRFGLRHYGSASS